MDIEREILLSAIKLVLPAMARKELFDQADKLAFVGGKVLAFDDHVMISHLLPGGLDLEGAVDGRRLLGLLDRLSVDVVKLAVGDGRIEVRAGRSRSSFDVLPVTLPYDSVDATGQLVDLPAGFVDQLRWVSTSCARDTSRPALNCVSVEGGWMQSSDSYRASRVHHGDVTTEAWALPRLMLPLPQVEVLVDYPVKRVALSDGGEWARFETDDGTMLCTRSMSAAFPDLTSVYDVRGREVQLTAALSEAIGRAEIFARRDHAIDEEVKVAMRPNQVTVSAQCDGGRFSEVVRCEGAPEAAEFGIHPKYLAKALESGTRCVLGERSIKFCGADWEHVIALKVG
jgi:hypothetical protein